MALHSADARQVLQDSLPFVLKHMTNTQMAQMQRVLDAAVLDPEIKEEAQRYYDRSIRRYGSLVVTDSAMVERGNRVMRGYVWVSEADQRIRLDVDALLEPHALDPVTDNPDEVAYLKRVRQTLQESGVWLRFSSKRVLQDPHDESTWTYDPHTFEAWLSLGPDGETIPTETGELTRDDILNTTLFGAGYYKRVILGPVQAALDRLARRLQIEIESGFQQYQELATIRREAAPGVVGVSDLLGDVTFPSPSIWEAPRKLVVIALELNVNGNVKQSQACLIAASVGVRKASRQIADYISGTSGGAETAAKWARRVRTAAEITEAVLGATGLVATALRGGAAAAGAAASDESIDAALQREVEKRLADDPHLLDESIECMKGPKGTVLRAKPIPTGPHGPGFDKWP